MLHRNLAYEASAGSGKTFMLVVRYLSLMFLGADPSKILALTFTNKAANEMQERIAATLEDLHDRDELHVIAETLEVSEAEILAQRDVVLRRFLKAPTKIMTIDSFFAKILRKFSLYVGLMPDFLTLSSQHKSRLMERFLSEVDVANAQKELIALSIESKKRMGDIFELLDQFYIKSKELSGFRFSDENFHTLEVEIFAIVERMKTLVDGCEKASKDAKNAFVVDDMSALLKKGWLGRDTLDYRTFKNCYTPQLDSYLQTLKNLLLRYFQAKEQRFFHTLWRLTQIYQKAKRTLYKAQNEVGFDDVTMLVYEIMRERIDNEFLYFRLDAKIEHILLDEFQDTSILQYEILHPLIVEALSGEGAKQEGSFFFVGDTKQSIYRFRGGVSSLFGEVAKLNGTHVEKLVTNYRSKKEVVEFVNDTFRDKIEGYTDQKVKAGADGGYVEVSVCEELLESCYERICLLREKGANYDEIAILCFTNGDGECTKEYLEKKNLPVVTETTLKLIHQKGVRALIEYLKYLYFKADLFKENFFALIGREVKIEWVDFNEKTPLKIAKNAIERYGLFEDLNVLAFLEVIGGYATIEELLFEYERIETEAIGSDAKGIRILTVHKSKGLEFEHVITLDRFGRAAADTSPIIYDYDGIELKNLFLRTSGREAFDSAYAGAKERAAQLSRIDALNGLYVAFTRAKNSLFVLKKQKQSAFDILELEETKRGEMVNVAPKKEQVATNVYGKLHKELYYGSQTNLLEGSKKLEEDQEAIVFGSAVHLFMEMLERFDVGAMEDAKEAVRNRYGSVLEESRLQDAASRVERLLRNGEFLALCAGECFKERALRYNKALYYIDLLVRTDEGYRIIDYKTGKHFHAEYVKQVRNYQKAIEAITGQEAQGYLCYLLEDRVEIERVV